MKTDFNRFALHFVKCGRCKKFIIFEKYRFDEFGVITRCMCKDCWREWNESENNRK